MEVGVPPPYGFTKGPWPFALAIWWILSLHDPLLPSLVVSISDVETVREGHESELLRSLAEEFPLERGFTIIFHGRRANLDLVANSVEEAEVWKRGLWHLMDFVNGMDQQERLDQYQQEGARVGVRGH